MKAIVVAICVLAGCGDNRTACVPGELLACGCAGGALGAQLCNASGTFEACTGCPADAGIEAIACSAQTDCPLDYDCGLAHSGDPMPTCYRRTYDTTTGAFGTSCAIAACAGTPLPCAPGFSCDDAFKCDPGATCTHACAGDPDCPPSMYCAADQQCTRREACDSCVVDDQCGAEARCATDAHHVRYCAKTCSSDADCPQPQVDPTTGGLSHPFERCRVDHGGHGRVCQPTDGYCHGPSAIGSQPDGGVCAWCRTGEPSDCTVGSCFESFTTERFCSIACTVSVHWNGVSFDAQDDTCPTGTFCYFGGLAECSTDCMVSGTCAGDPTYQFLTCYP